MPVTLPIRNEGRHPLPSYATQGAAGMDIRANIDAPVVLHSLERSVIPTGIYVQVPDGYELQVRARSGLAAKHGIALANGIGTIDADYRGEIGVVLINLSDTPYTIRDGDRIAQLVLMPIAIAEPKEVRVLEETSRGAGGFGHSGYA